MRSTLTAFFAFIAFVSLAYAAPYNRSSYVVKERVIPHRNWVKHSAAPSDDTIILRIALAQSNFPALEKHLYEVSNPDHKRYGQYLSKAEVDELVAPHPDSIDSVNQWLESYGIGESDVTRSSSKDWMTLTVPISLAEAMLDTKYSVWRHVETGDFIVRTTSYSLPQDLYHHVDVVQPTTMFSQIRPANVMGRHGALSPPDTWANLPQITDSVSGSIVNASCNTTITIDCLLQLYNVAGYKASASSNNSIAIASYLHQYANFDDLQSFYADQRPEAVGSSFEVVSVNGGLNNQSLASKEANLDSQFAFGMSYPIPSIEYSTAGMPPFTPDEITISNNNEPYMEWVDFLLAQENPPMTISTSYLDHEQTVPESYAQRVCTSFAQLGARGVSLLFASGDFGVGDGIADPATQQCQTNDGRNMTRFIPSFPASCPYVTAVGATTRIPEVASLGFFSGGGFSDYFARPSYQDDAVSAFLKTLPKGTYKDLYNPNGRGFPDISAQSENFRIFWQGAPFTEGGTSASTPVVSGIIALLNDVRLANGQPPLGFLNPMLYSKGIAGLNDVTAGNNPGCGTPGFNATKGWDPVTGLGTPNFEKLRKIVIV